MRQRFVALLAGFAVFAFAATPASAAPYMSWGQWTSDPGVPFSQCWHRGAQALASAGLSASQDGRFFHGSNDVFIASLICYDLGNRFIVTITVAQSGASSMTTDQVRDQIQSVIFGSGGGTAQTPTAQSGGSGWDANATALRGRNGQRFSFACEANGHLSSVWGTDIYTDDSRVCSAAVHAGLITLQSGGTVTIEIRAGQDSYAASTRNGVNSGSWGSWTGSYVFVQ